MYTTLLTFNFNELINFITNQQHHALSKIKPNLWQGWKTKNKIPSDQDFLSVNGHFSLLGGSDFKF